MLEVQQSVILKLKTAIAVDGLELTLAFVHTTKLFWNQQLALPV